MTVLILLMIATFTSAFGLGAIQFFTLENLVLENGPDSRDWLIQAIGATMTSGPIIVYLFSGPFAAAFNKRNVMFFSAVLAGAILLLGGFIGWAGSVWIYLTATGMFLGIFNAGKMGSVPLLSKMMHKNTTVINATMSIVFLLGLLSGFPAGTYFHGVCPTTGFIYCGVLFFVTGMIGAFCKYTDEKLVPYPKAQREILSDTREMLGKHLLFLLMGPILWGVAGAAQLAITAMVVRRDLGTPASAAIIPLFAAIGAITGNLISPLFFKRRYMLATFFAILMACFLLLIPVVCNSYLMVVIAAVILGVLFGSATNLNDSAFLERIGNDGKEGVGGALQSAMLAVFSVSAGTIVFIALYRGKIGPDAAFVLFSFFTFFSAFLGFMIYVKYGEGRAFIVNIFKNIVKMAFSLRYKVEVEGLDKIDLKKGVLILPNHPAEMDPVANTIWLWSQFKPRVVVTEDFMEMPGLNKVFALIDALPMPNMESGKGLLKVRRMQRTLDQITTGLAAGDNFIIYPSGRLSRDGSEQIGGASATHSLVEENPNINVLMVHSEGFWGSSFSWIYSNDRPDLFKQLLHGLKVIICHGIFFVPKRKIKIVVKLNPSDFPRKSSRANFNKWLEDWHADFGEVKINYVTYNRLTGKLPELKLDTTARAVDLSNIAPELQQEIIANIAKVGNLKAENIEVNQSLRFDLGFDSLEMAGIIAMLNEDYNAIDVSIADLATIGSVIELAAGGDLQAKEQITPAPESWGQNLAEVSLTNGESVIECFLRKAEANKKAPIFSDDMAGVMTYGQARLRIILLAKIIKDLPGERIGIMLPALVATDIVFMATQLAGKVPVMINWTLGESNLKYVIETAELEVILSSSTFIDNLEYLALDILEEKLYFLDKLVKEKASKIVKVTALMDSFKSTSSLIKKFKVDKSLTAVILFTSGSEAKPKGVPLSHQNLLSQVSCADEILRFDKNDVFYGFLPPFHSFGMTVTTILPLLLGVRVSYFPNPTSARKIATGIGKWQATFVAGTPTFLNGIMRAAQGDCLKSLRYMVTGAEKAPQELMTKASQINADIQVLEGYGITECSPIVSVCRPNGNDHGVGQTMTDVEAIIVDMDTFEPLTSGQRGLILVRGKSIFDGYFGKKVADPFCIVNDKKWYNTGDLGIIDAGNSIIINGRLKRFVKIAGEMISLPAMETLLIERWPNLEAGPQIAIDSLDRDGQRPIICLFCIEDIDKSVANNFLRENGFSNLVKISDVIQIAEIPLLGTGKTDYQTLKKILLENV